MPHRLARLTAALLAVATLALPAGAQRRGEEFTTQGMVVGSFESTPPQIGRTLANRVRDKVGDAVSDRELKVINRRTMETELVDAGFTVQTTLARAQTTALARLLRADEYVTGTVERVGGVYRVQGYLVLARDDRLRQLLPRVEDANLDRAADRVASAVIAARMQIAPQRRCENLMREGKHEEAMAAALPGITAYPRSTLARACYLTALSLRGSTADTLLALANAMLAVDPANSIALQHAGIALDVKRDRPRAAEMWTRLLATDTTTVALAEFVIGKLARGGNAAAALPLVERVAAKWPDEIELARLRFLVLLTTEQWKPAIDAGLRLAALDSGATGDPQYFERLATAYRADSQPARALETAARGVGRYPDDPDLYLLYAQLVRAEAEVVLPRGATQFAQSAKIQALHAQALRASGGPAGLRASLDATRRALAIDPSLPRGFLQLAQLHLELGAPDSALAALGDALANGEDSTRVAQYALARGNALYRAASTSRQLAEFQRAAGFLSLAGRVKPTKESTLLFGAASFSIGQIAVTEAATTRDCAASRLADSAFAEAEIALPSAGAVSPDAARQMLEYVAQARPALAQQLATFCENVP